jgi:ABC-type branched-subunit amino acid transport system substrate-binding protein
MKLRRALFSLGCTVALATSTLVTSAWAADPLKVGLMEDVSGDLAFMGKPKLNGSLLAVEEINKAGGIMGRQVELIHLDPQGDNARYQEFTRRLLSKDKVDVLIGGITSASREAVRPIVDRTQTPYFYTNQYEGGVCDANMISMGAVPEQQFSTLIPYMVEKFIPLGVSQFAQTIQNIQKAKPDWLLMLNVGAAQDSFFEQAAAAKLNLPMGSSVKVMLGFEHKRFAPPALNRMHATANWFEEIDSPAATDFKKRWHAKFPNEPYINDMGYNAYNALYMYKTLVEKAKSTKLADLRKVIAAGEACIDAGEGKVCIDPKSQHASHQMRLIAVDDKHKVNVLKDYGTIQPYWLGKIGCDLTKNNDKKQYTPSDLPKKS